VSRLLPIFLLGVCAAGAQTSDSEWGRVRAYFSAGVVFSEDAARFSKQTPFAAFSLDKNWRSGDRVYLNSFFETRLTSIAVAGAESAFPSSEKVAHAGAGFYAPVVTTRWEFGGQGHALFAAPLLVAGFDTPTGEQRDRFFTSAGGGVRLGHCKTPKEATSAPELISWLDVVYGRYPNLDPHRGRLALEGTLRAPGTPVIVGFAANIGRSGSARDDLRFFLGTRFDLGALIAKLRQP